MTHDKCPTCGAERLEIENRFVSTLWCPYCGTIQSVGCTAYVPRDRAAMAAEIATLTASRDKWRGLAEKLVDTVQSLAAGHARLRELVEAAYREGWKRGAVSIHKSEAAEGLAWSISQARKALDQQPEQTGNTNA